MRADRLISLLLLLQTKGRLPAREVAQRLDISVRTVYRDMDALAMAGIPVYTERGPRGGCALEESYRTSLTGLNPAEVHALFISQAIGPMRDLSLDRASESALLKLSVSLPAAHREEVERIRQRLHLDSTGWFHRDESLPDFSILQQAIWEDRRLRIIYRRADGELGERGVSPFGLVAKAGVWYLVGETEAGRRVYRVSRLESVHLLDERFERPANFDLGQCWAECQAEFKQSLACYAITVRLAPESLACLNQWYGDDVLQQVTLPDHEGWRTFSLTFDSIETARMFVLNLGAGAEVLSPAALRESVVKSAEAIAAFYARRAGEAEGNANA